MRGPRSLSDSTGARRVPSAAIAAATCAIDGRDRSPEALLHRAGGLTIVIGAIVPRNTVQMARVIGEPRAEGDAIADTVLSVLSPLGRRHISLIGDCMTPPLRGGATVAAARGA